VNVRITGSGRVEVKSGTARRVSDSFAKDIAGDTVDNYRESVFNVDAELIYDEKIKKHTVLLHDSYNVI
jgi:hypothetical protein